MTDFTPTEEEIRAFDLAQHIASAYPADPEVRLHFLILRLAARALAYRFELQHWDCADERHNWQPADWIKYAAEHPQEWQG